MENKEISELLLDIADKIRNAGGSCELVDSKGNNCIYDREKCVPISQLILDKEGDPAAVIPLGYFSDDMIEKVIESMQ